MKGSSFGWGQRSDDSDRYRPGQTGRKPPSPGQGIVEIGTIGALERGKTSELAGRGVVGVFYPQKFLGSR